MREALGVAAFLVGLFIIVVPAASQDRSDEGVRVPHTKIWVTEGKVSDWFSADSMWNQIYGEDETCVIVTKNEQKTMRERDNLKVGDCLLYLDGFIVSDIEWLSKRMNTKSKEAIPSDGDLRVAREGEDYEYPAYLMQQKEE